MPASHLFTQAYGTQVIRDQALYLAWSALAWRRTPELVVHVYTDDPGVYEPLASMIEVRTMTPEDVRRWRGPFGFTHRLKALLVQDMVRRFPEERQLYLDADTYLIHPPEEVLERLGPQTSVMHARESHLLEGNDPHLRNFSRRMRPLTFRGKPVDLNHWMWNAGAIGLHPESFGAVDDWIAFIDEVWPRYKRGLVEQYGIAMRLQQGGEVLPCNDAIVHYWYQKNDFTTVIRRELAVLRTRPLSEALLHLRQRPIHVPFREQPNHRMPFWKKWRRSFFGER